MSKVGKIVLTIIVVFGLLTIGLSIAVPATVALDPVRKADANRLTTRTEIERQQAEFQLELMRQESDVRRVADEQRILAIGQAQVRAITALGYFVAIALFALVIATIILCVGLSASLVRYSASRANIVTIGTEQRTLQAPPYLIVGQWAVMPTGERFRINSPAQVSAMKALLSARNTDTALMNRSNGPPIRAMLLE